MSSRVTVPVMRNACNRGRRPGRFADAGGVEHGVSFAVCGPLPARVRSGRWRCTNTPGGDRFDVVLHYGGRFSHPADRRGRARSRGRTGKEACPGTGRGLSHDPPAAGRSGSACAVACGERHGRRRVAAPHATTRSDSDGRRHHLTRREEPRRASRHQERRRALGHRRAAGGPATAPRPATSPATSWRAGSAARGMAGTRPTPRRIPASGTTDDRRGRTIGRDAVISTTGVLGEARRPPILDRTLEHDGAAHPRARPGASRSAPARPHPMERLRDRGSASTAATGRFRRSPG